MVKQFYEYTTRNIDLGDDYRIPIKSRNIVGAASPLELGSKSYVKKFIKNEKKDG